MNKSHAKNGKDRGRDTDWRIIRLYSRLLRRLNQPKALDSGHHGEITVNFRPKSMKSISHGVETEDLP